MENPETQNFGRRAFVKAATVGVATTAASSVFANTMKPSPIGADTNRNGRFAGKVVLVTGATSGIGKTTAEAFAREGARVFFNGRRADLGEAVADSIRNSGGEASYRQGDMRDPAQVEAFVVDAVSRFGQIDIFYNNAGIFMTPAELQDIPVENYLDIMQTNAAGTFFGMKFVIPVMRKQGRGSIVNMASVAGHKGFASTAAYNASKHAIIGMTKAAAVANARHNIRVNSISPLAVDTPQLQESFAFQGLTYEKMAPNFVTPRIMTTDEIARAVMFLSSDEATSITGMDLDVTGGQLA